MPDVLDVIVETVALEAQIVAKQRAPVRTGYLRDHINIHYEGQAHQKVISEAGYSGFQEFGFQHYADGFIPGKFYMTGALNHIAGLIAESTVIRDILSSQLVPEIEPPSPDI